MKLKSNLLYISVLIFMIACGNSSSVKTTSTQPIGENVVPSSGEEQQGGLVGEWEQQYTCFDKNGNYKLEPEEKTPSNTKLGFNWFRFNADGSCLRDKDVQFTGNYSIEKKNGDKKLLIEGGDNLRYSIAELTDKELVLGADGAFIVFKRIK